MGEERKGFGYWLGYYVIGPLLLVAGMAALGALAFVIGSSIR